MRNSARTGRSATPCGRAAVANAASDLWASDTVSLGECPRLALEQRPIRASDVHQFVVSAVLGDVAVFEDNDAVGMADRGEAVRDQDRRDRSPSCQVLIEHRVEEAQFGAGVEVGGGFVEDQQTCAALDRVECARQGNSLPLATGQIDAATGARMQRGVPSQR